MYPFLAVVVACLPAFAWVLVAGYLNVAPARTRPLLKAR